MSSSPIGAAIVGTGFGLFAHVRALREAGFEVRAIVGRDRARTAARAAPMNIPLATDNLAEALEDRRIQIVTVATPPHAHFKPVMEAIAAGRHVICEKPFARNAEEARIMRDAAKAAGVVNMLGAEFRFDSAQATLRRVVREGRIGQPLHFLRMFHVPVLTNPAAELSSWWVDADQGGGFLGAFGSHMVDQVDHLFGPIAHVSAILQTLAPGRPGMTADDCYSVQFESANGVKGLLMGALAAPGPFVVTTKVVGTAGGAWIQAGPNYGDPEQVWIADLQGPRQIEIPADLVNPPPTPFPVPELIQTEQDRWHSQGMDVAPYARLFAEARAHIEGQQPEIPERAATFDDALRGQAVLDAIRRSASERRWVSL